MKELILLAPEIFLTSIALLLLLGDAFAEGKRRLWTGVTMISLVVAGGLFWHFFSHHEMPFAASFGLQPVQSSGWMAYSSIFSMVAVDSLAIFFKLALVAAVLVVLWLSIDYPEFSDVPFGTFCSLLLLATVGLLLLVGTTDLILAVIALELIGIPSFILTGFVFHRRSASEAALKYFLVGSLSTAILLFGISFYYGYFGTTSIQPLLDYQAGGRPVDFAVSTILVLLLSGLGFKLSMVPFHMWAPDTYEGAPTPITAFLSVAPKAAAVGFLLRFLGHHAVLQITPVLAVLAALTMTVGNLGALPQKNIKRLLAYSSIAQVGYILVALVGGGAMGIQAVMLYTFIYLFMNLGVFTILITVANSAGTDDLDGFAGLSKKSLGLSVTMMLLLLSLTGIPPLAGFIGKFSVFASLITQKSLLWLGIVAVLNSVVSLYYYFKIAHQMFFCEPTTSAQPKLTPALLASLVVTVSVTLFVGVMPNPLLSWVRNLVGS